MRITMLIFRIIFFAKIEFNFNLMDFKGTLSPVTHARDGARSLESVRQTILISLGESLSVFIELYLSHPCEVCLIVVSKTCMTRSRRAVRAFVRLDL